MKSYKQKTVLIVLIIISSIIESIEVKNNKSTTSESNGENTDVHLDGDPDYPSESYYYDNYEAAANNNDAYNLAYNSSNMPVSMKRQSYPHVASTLSSSTSNQQNNLAMSPSSSSSPNHHHHQSASSAFSMSNSNRMSSNHNIFGSVNNHNLLSNNNEQNLSALNR